jgi:hypothetical protein
LAKSQQEARHATADSQLPAEVVRLVEAIGRMMARSDHDSEAGNSLHNKEESGSDDPGKEAS